MPEPKPNETTQPASFEEAVKRLEAIVERMEAGAEDLDAMVKDFEEGRRLVAFCTKELEGIRQRIEKVTSAEPPAVEPLSII